MGRKSRQTVNDLIRGKAPVVADTDEGKEAKNLKDMGTQELLAELGDSVGKVRGALDALDAVNAELAARLEEEAAPEAEGA